MFEKESEEYAQDMTKYYESAHGSIPSQFEKYLRKAVEFGYNKANEWHYVKDGKLDDVIDTWDKKRKYLIMARFTNNLGEYDEVPLLAYFDHCFSQKWCTSKLDYLSKFYITWWKEIVLPELKESE